MSKAQETSVLTVGNLVVRVLPVAPGVLLMGIAPGRIAVLPSPS
jgi:hypothetical protein